MSRNTIIGVIVAAIVVAGAVIGIQVSRSSSNSTSVYAKKYTADQANVDKLLSGIPQSGRVLGTPKAPVHIVEYMDYKCPVCGDASKNLVPPVITQYVRTGKATIELRPVAVIGNLVQSQNSGFAGLATVPQNRMWQFTELILRNQGYELDPWLTNAVLTAAATTAGVNVSTWMPVFQGNAVTATFFADETQFQQDTSSAGLSEGTPTFVVTGPKGTPQVVQGDVPIAQIAQAIARVSGSKA